MPADPKTREILDKASRYVILKSDQGVTVGLHIDGRHYGEGHSATGDLDEAIREAYARATAAEARPKKRSP